MVVLSSQAAATLLQDIVLAVAFLAGHVGPFLKHVSTGGQRRPGFHIVIYFRISMDINLAIACNSRYHMVLLMFFRVSHFG